MKRISRPTHNLRALPVLVKARSIAPSLSFVTRPFALFIIALLISLSVTVLQPVSASAAVADWMPSERAQQWAYLNGLQKCIKESALKSSSVVRQGQIDVKDIQSGEWWGKNGWIEQKRASSYLFGDVDKSDGRALCNDLSKAAISLWGFGDGLDLLCSISDINRGDGSSCRTGSGERFNKSDVQKQASKLRTFITKEVWGGATPSPSGAGYYVLFLSAFKGFCSPKKNENPPADFKYVITEVATNGVTTKVTYEGKKHDQQTHVYTSEALNDVERSCAYIAGKINEHASANAQWAKDNPGKTDTGAPTKSGNAAGEEASTCVVDGVGWIICATANFMATITDGMYEHVIANMLDVPPLNVNTADGKNGAYNAWSMIRNLANVLFVIAFLIIVYAQITGGGMTNYAIKKMLPRIVLSAVLVNISYWIAAIGVDISNILGAGTYDLMQSVRGGLNIGNVNGWAAVTTLLLSGGAIAGAAVGITLVAGALTPAIAMSLLGILLPLLLGALLAIFIVIFILVARQAILVILIIAAPLAFVAFLLPNTQKWFTKWRQWFVSLLLLYPIVSFIVGGAQIAGLVLISTATSGFTDAIGDTIKIMSGLSAMVVPFFMLPFLIRRYGGAGLDRVAGNLKTMGGKIAAPVSRFGRKQGIQGLGRSWESMKSGNVPTTRGRRLGGIRSRLAGRATGAAQRYDQWQSRGKMESEHYADQQKEALLERLGGDEQFRMAAAGGDAAAADRLAARADHEVHERRKKDASAMLRNLTRDQRIELSHGRQVMVNGRAVTPDVALQAAAVENVAPSLDSREALDLADTIGSGSGVSPEVRRSAVASLAGKAPQLSGSQLGHLENDTYNRSDATLAGLNGGKFNAEWMATKAKAADIDELAAHIVATTDLAERTRLQGIVDDAVSKLDSTDTLRARVVKGSDMDQALNRVASSR